MSWQTRVQQRLSEQRAQQRWRSKRVVDSAQQPNIQTQGRRLLNFSSNDYLGLASNPSIVFSQQEALKIWGTGSGASHLICGHQTPHEEAERKLAEFVGAESALLFSTGYMANLALASALVTRGDWLLQDKLNHASLIDAARMSDATLRRYPHLDMTRLGALLNRHSDGLKLVATDSVFSMDGDLAPIAELSALTEAAGALLWLDDAHGFGTLGQNGRGSLDAAGLCPSGHRIMMGTLGKALGVAGAFVAADQPLIDLILQFGRTYTYTTAMPPANAAAICAALDVLHNQPWRHTQLTSNIHYFQRLFKEKIAPLKTNLHLLTSETAIQPIVVTHEQTALHLAGALEQQGILVLAIRPPTVPAGTSRLRITLTASHSHTQIEQLIDALAHVVNQPHAWETSK